MNFYDPRHTPDSSGTLHQWDNETANCGMGAIANLNGEKSYQIIDYAITSVCNMTHRGAVDNMCAAQRSTTSLPRSASLPAASARPPGPGPA